jgi:hypothetical protein
MADLVQLDVAAALVGKSEVTLRRLIKAGKVPVHKEKTLTGFIYLIDPAKLQAYYESRGEVVFESMEEAPTEPVSKDSGARRLAVAGENGGEVTYWQKRAETYEERYHAELQKHASAREELGIWRGRAEHAQAMLMKLLPPVPEVLMNTSVEVPEKDAKPLKRRDDTSPGVMILLVTTVVISFFLLAGAVVYVILSR